MYFQTYILVQVAFLHHIFWHIHQNNKLFSYNNHLLFRLEKIIILLKLNSKSNVIYKGRKKKKNFVQTISDRLKREKMKIINSQQLTYRIDFGY